MNPIFRKAINAFSLAFFGVLIPEICAVLSGSIPPDMHSFSLVVVPMICASFSAGLSAMWNYLSGVLKNMSNNFGSDLDE